MKEKFKLEDLDCVNYATKMGAIINETEGIGKAAINFMTQRPTIEADEDRFSDIINQIVAVHKKVGPDYTILM